MTDYDKQTKNIIQISVSVFYDKQTKQIFVVNLSIMINKEIIHDQPINYIEQTKKLPLIKQPTIGCQHARRICQPIL